MFQRERERERKLLLDSGEMGCCEPFNTLSDQTQTPWCNISTGCMAFVHQRWFSNIYVWIIYFAREAKAKIMEAQELIWNIFKFWTGWMSNLWFTDLMYVIGFMWFDCVFVSVCFLSVFVSFRDLDGWIDGMVLIFAIQVEQWDVR